MVSKKIMFSVLIPFSCTVHHLECRNKPPKIVGLIQVRNEEKVIEQCLKGLAWYTDAIVVVDDGSTDKTLSILKRLSKPLHIEKIVINKKSSWEVRDERYNRQKLLDAGRKVGGTHFIRIDADEMFSANCAHNNWLRKKILSLKPGQMMRMTEINLWEGLDYFRDDMLYGPRSRRWRKKSLVLCDDGQCNYDNNTAGGTSKTLHVLADPVNRKTKKGVPRLVDQSNTEKVLLHFNYVNPNSIYVKRAWYMCLELIRRNEKVRTSRFKENAIKINKQYNNAEYLGMHPLDRNAVKKTPVNRKWFDGYSFLNPSVYLNQNHEWRKNQVLKWFVQYGADYFKDLDIWDLDWIKRARGIQKNG